MEAMPSREWLWKAELGCDSACSRLSTKMSTVPSADAAVASQTRAAMCSPARKQMQGVMTVVVWMRNAVVIAGVCESPQAWKSDPMPAYRPISMLAAVMLRVRCRRKANRAGAGVDEMLTAERGVNCKLPSNASRSAAIYPSGSLGFFQLTQRSRDIAVMVAFKAVSTGGDAASAGHTLVH